MAIRPERPESFSFDAVNEYLDGVKRRSLLIPILKELQSRGGQAHLRSLQVAVSGSPGLIAQDLAVAEEKGLITVLPLQGEGMEAQLTSAGAAFLSEDP